MDEMMEVSVQKGSSPHSSSKEPSYEVVIGNQIESVICDESSCKNASKDYIFSNDLAFLCNICNGSFPEKSTLQKHKCMLASVKAFSPNVNHKDSSETDELSESAYEKSFVCNLCGKICLNKNCLEQHHYTHSKKKLLACKMCSRIFSRKSNLQRHLLTHTGEKPFQCDVCNMAFSVKYNWKKHYLTHTNKNSTVMGHEDNQSASDVCSESLCEETLEDIICSNVLICDVCNETFDSKSALKKHNCMTTKENAFVDILNDKDFSKADASCKNSKEKSFGFSNKICVEQNDSVHTMKKPFVCEVCSKEFPRKFSLERHLLTHTGEKPFQCDICNKAFQDKARWANHYRIHTNEKPFVCDICGRAFKERSALGRHLTTHTDEKPFACDLCSKRFNRKYSLIKHNFTHTNEKPVRCNVCNKSFFDRSVLKRHLLIHTGEKPFVCDKCGKGFRQKNCLVTHYYTHASKKPFACDVCGKAFCTKRALKNHKDTHTDLILSV